MSDQKNDSPFFIGWEAKTPKPIGAFLKKTALLLLVSSLVVAGIVTVLQSTVSTGRFDFGNVQEFTGVLIKSPVPMLVADKEVEGEKIFYLVGPMKYGFPTDVAEKHHLQQVTLKGTFIGDAQEAMIEVVDGSVASAGQAGANPLQVSDLGEVTLAGEIVDSKCHLGVMNPGRLKPHRACAINCLSGGIPPILVAQTADGQIAHYLLVGKDGSAIHDDVLEYVAEPVELTGALKVIGNRKALYFDPSTIKRL